MEKTLFMGFALSAKYALKDAIRVVGDYCSKVAPIDDTATDIIDNLTGALVELQLAVSTAIESDYFGGENK
jgi:hypothetical protein